MILYWLLLIGIVLTVLWKTSPAAKKYIKFTVFVIYCFSITLLIPLWLYRGRNCRNANLSSAGFRAICKFLQLKHSVEGQENVVPNSGSVIIINHQSSLDLIVLACIWPYIQKCTVVSKKSLLYIPGIGLCFYLAGALFIDRSKPSEAHEALNKTGTLIRDSKLGVIMFPEGTRHNGTKLSPFKKGGFHLAVAAKCPIQPVCVNRYTFLGPNKFESGEIKIRILPAISTEGCTAEDIPRLIEESYKVMSENVEDLTKSIKSD